MPANRAIFCSRFHQAFECAVFGLDFLEIVGLAETVDVDKIDMIGLQAFEAGFEAAQEFITRAIGNLRGQPDIFAACGHYAADAGFALAIAVCVSRVEIRDAKINRAIEDRCRVVYVLVHQEATAAAECEDRDFRTRSS